MSFNCRLDKEIMVNMHYGVLHTLSFNFICTWTFWSSLLDLTAVYVSLDVPQRECFQYFRSRSSWWSVLAHDYVHLCINGCYVHQLEQWHRALQSRTRGPETQDCAVSEADSPLANPLRHQHYGDNSGLRRSPCVQFHILTWMWFDSTFKTMSESSKKRYFPILQIGK